MVHKHYMIIHKGGGAPGRKGIFGDNL